MRISSQELVHLTPGQVIFMIDRKRLGTERAIAELVVESDKSGVPFVRIPTIKDGHTTAVSLPAIAKSMDAAMSLYSPPRYFSTRESAEGAIHAHQVLA